MNKLAIGAICALSLAGCGDRTIHIPAIKAMTHACESQRGLKEVKYRAAGLANNESYLVICNDFTRYEFNRKGKMQ